MPTGVYKHKSPSLETRERMSRAQRGKIHAWYARKPHSLETREKISQALKGKKLSEETKRKIVEALKKIDRKGEKSPSWKGGPIKKNCEFCGKEYQVRQYRKNSAKFCSFSCRQKRFWQASEYKANFIRKVTGRIVWNKGKKLVPLSEEHKRKVSEALKGKAVSEETRKKISEALKGEKNRFWKGGPIGKNCKFCGRDYYIPRCKESLTKFCSVSCHANYLWQTPESRANLLNKRGKIFKDTSIELKTESLLRGLGIEYKKQVLLFNIAVVDFYLPRRNLVIQCDGCFWHGCPIHNQSWSKRRERDASQDTILQQNGLIVLRFWEHEIKSEDFPKKLESSIYHKSSSLV